MRIDLKSVVRDLEARKQVLAEMVRVETGGCVRLVESAVADRQRYPGGGGAEIGARGAPEHSGELDRRHCGSAERTEFGTHLSGTSTRNARARGLFIVVTVVVVVA